MVQARVGNILEILILITKLFPVSVREKSFRHEKGE